jgi:hypothetical protein
MSEIEVTEPKLPEELLAEMVAPPGKIDWDSDTTFFQGRPLIILGETYHGTVTFHNPTKYQYIVLNVESGDKDASFTQLTDGQRTIMPGKELTVRFELSPKKSRKEPVSFTPKLHGGYVM